MLLSDVVAFAAAARPDAVALVDGPRRITFAELWSDVEAMAVRLRALTRTGDRVMWISANRAEMVAFLYAAPLAGVVAMFGNTRLHPVELHAQIDDGGPSVVIGSAEQLQRLEPAALAGVRTVVGLDPGAGDVVLSDLPAHGSGSGGTRSRREAPARPGDVAWMIHTSGTTGAPKGACLTHRSILAAVLNTSMGRPLLADDVYLFPFPLFHVASYNVVHAHLRGCPVVLVASFDASEVLELIGRHQVTAMSLAPTMISMLLDHPARPQADLGSLRTIAYGASAIPLDTLRRALTELGCDVAQGYGMTELSGNAVFLDAAMHRRALAGEDWLLGACGVAGPLCSVRLVDDDGRDVADGDDGEVWVRGDQVFSHYWERPDATAEAFVGEWLRTGDVGRRREGVLSIVDRRKDLIVSGGENVASRQVEDVLGAHPDVESVAVVARADPRWGESVCAVVVPRDPERFSSDELVAWARTRLGGFKVPRSVVVVEALPLGASGKVLKAELRDLVGTLDGRPATGENVDADAPS